jgi:hypothetical protein
VDALRITIDTDHNLSTYEEIDAVQLMGSEPIEPGGPRVVTSTPAGAVVGPVDRIELSFSKPIQEGTFTLEDVVGFHGPAGPIAVTAVNRLSESEYEVLFTAQEAVGDYTLTIGPQIADLSGTPMDQDQDGTPGELEEDRYEAAFQLEMGQYASRVIGYSSQYSYSYWSARRALGPPDTWTYGDSALAWTPASRNGTEEWLTVGFDIPVFSTGAIIRETYGNGFVRRLEVRDASTGTFETVSTQEDPSQPGTPVDYSVSWPRTTYLVDALRITIDTDHNLSTYEEIDAVELLGDDASQQAASLIDESLTSDSGSIRHANTALAEWSRRRDVQTAKEKTPPVGLAPGHPIDAATGQLPGGHVVFPRRVVSSESKLGDNDGDVESYETPEDALDAVFGALPTLELLLSDGTMGRSVASIA